MSSREALLFNEYEPEAIKIARGFKLKLPLFVETGDLEGAARLGLWRGILRAKKHLTGEITGDSLSLYLKKHIRGAVIDELRRQDWLPRRARARKEVPQVVYFEQLSRYDAQQSVRLEAPDFADQIDQERRQRRLAGAIFQLRPRDREIVLRVLNGEKMRDIGHSLGVSEPRVSQIFKRERLRITRLMQDLR